MERSGWCGGKVHVEIKGCGDGVFVDAIEEAFYYAEGDKTADVDAGEEGEIIEHPGAKGKALSE